MTVTTKQIRAAITADMVSKKRNGNYIARQSYYYGVTQDGHAFANRVMLQLRKAGINATQIDYGNHFANFNSNHSVAKGSHYYVEFVV